MLVGHKELFLDDSDGGLPELEAACEVGASVPGSDAPPTSAGTAPAEPGRKKRQKTEQQILRNRQVQQRYRQRVIKRNQQTVELHEQRSAELLAARQLSGELRAGVAALEATLAVREDWVGLLRQVESSAGKPATVAATHSPSLLIAALAEDPLVGALSQSLESAAATSSTHSSSSTKDGAGGDSTRTAGQASAASSGTVVPPPPPAPAAQPAPAVEKAPAKGARLPGRPGRGATAQSDPLATLAEQLGSCLPPAVLKNSERSGSSEGAEMDTLQILQALPVRPEEAEAVQACTPDQLTASWVRHVGRVKELLAQYDASGSEEQMAELARVMLQWELLTVLILAKHPRLQQHLMAAQLGPVLPEEEEERKWDAIAASMALSTEARAVYLALGEEYEARVQALRENRARALELIREGVDSGPELRAAGLSERFGLYLRTWQGALDLAAHPDMEFMAALELFRGASMHWSPLQKARLMAGAVPDFPDILKLLCALRRSKGAPGQG